jgi:hypothetical protein
VSLDTSGHTVLRSDISSLESGKQSKRQVSLALNLPSLIMLFGNKGIILKRALHLKRSHPSIMDLRLEKSLLQQKILGSLRNFIWRNRTLQKGKPSMKEYLLSVLLCKIWSDIWHCS